MDSTRNREKNEILSLNSQLPKLFVEELEERLETDPLMIGAFMNTFGIVSEDQAVPRCWFITCETAYSCGWD